MIEIDARSASRFDKGDHCIATYNVSQAVCLSIHDSRLPNVLISSTHYQKSTSNQLSRLNQQVCLQNGPLNTCTVLDVTWFLVKTFLPARHNYKKKCD